MLALAATCLMVALAAPTAGAAGAGSSKATSKANASQTAKASVTKKRLARNIRAINRRSKSNRRNIAALRSSLAKLGTDLRAAISGGDKTVDDKINGIVGVVTPILQQLGAGSLALKDGLEKLAAGTTAGFETVKAGFADVETAIRQVATSQEYGVVGVFADNGGSGTLCCRIITAGSADIPDDGNNVTAGGTIPVRVLSSGANPAQGTFAEDTEITLRAAIRSGETDGTGEDDPAGQVGGLMTVKCVAIGGCGTLPIGPPPGEGQPPSNVPVSSGDLICSVGPTPNQEIETPNGPAQLGLEIIPEKADRTDQSRPTIDDVDPFARISGPPRENDAGAAGTSNPASNGTDGRCTLPNAGTYEVDVTTQFVDIPTSTTPGPTE